MSISDLPNELLKMKFSNADFYAALFNRKKTVREDDKNNVETFGL